MFKSFIEQRYNSNRLIDSELPVTMILQLIYLVLLID